MKYSELLARNRELAGELANFPKYTVGIISNVVMFQLKPILEMYLRESGINADVILGDYDSIVQDSHRLSYANAVIIFWELGNLVNGIHFNASSMSTDDIQALESRVASEMDMVLNNLKTVPLVLINKFSSSLFEPSALRQGPLQKMAYTLNKSLYHKVSSSQIVVDINHVIAAVGLNRSADFRQFQQNKSLYSPEFLRYYSIAVIPAFKAANGVVKKLIVLDCDNTLWGGILGEDGNNIQIGENSTRGKIFREVQSMLVGLQNEGVLLALCSKNNPEDVDQILSDHPDMVIRDQHLVAKKVNWLDKLTNIKELGRELNLGLESFVFIDDSDFELGLIRKELPMVDCVQVPSETSDYPHTINQMKDIFFTLSTTREDKVKTSLYKQEGERKSEINKYSSLDEYLESLKLELTVCWDQAITSSRAVQMTQKTNQFNLTTKRYTEGDIERMLGDKSYKIASFSLADRYGDYGVTALVIIKLDENIVAQAQIDSFMMSCRIIGRKVENTILDEVVRELQFLGIKNLNAQYISTAKNAQVENFYETMGFTVIEEKVGKKVYNCTINAYRKNSATFVKLLNKI